MKIVIDLDELVINDISLEQYYLLNLIHFNRLDLMVQYTDKYGEFKISLVEDLKTKGFITYQKFKGDLTSVSLTKLGIDMIHVYTEETKELSSSIDNFCDKQYEKFPPKIKSGGYLVRSGKVGFRLKLKKFIKSNEYSLDVIDKAFTSYIDEKRRSGWNYIKLAGYFVSKDNESTLASYCESVINNPVQEVVQAGHMKAF